MVLRVLTMAAIQNTNPHVYAISTSAQGFQSFDEVLDSLVSLSPSTSSIDAREVFEHLRHLNDPEHPLTLEQLNVIRLENITVGEASCDVLFTPTIPHCSMATLIGLSIRVKLLRSLPTRYKVTVRIEPGTHASEFAVNRQLNDKERVRAALENTHLLRVVDQCIAHTDPLLMSA